MPTLYIKKGKKYIPVIRDKENGVKLSTITSCDELAEIESQFLTDRMTLGEGLWLMKIAKNCSSLGLVTKIADIPSHPYDFTAIMSKRNELADFIVKFKREFAIDHPHADARKGYSYTPSESELAQAILDYLADLSGVGGFGFKKEQNRRLDPDL